MKIPCVVPPLYLCSLGTPTTPTWRVIPYQVFLACLSASTLTPSSSDPQNDFNRGRYAAPDPPPTPGSFPKHRWRATLPDVSFPFQNSWYSDWSLSEHKDPGSSPPSNITWRREHVNPTESLPSGAYILMVRTIKSYTYHKHMHTYIIYDVCATMVEKSEEGS